MVGGIVFLAQGFGKWKQATAGIALLIGLSVFLIEPLNNALYQLYIRGTAVRVMNALTVHQPDLFTGAGKIEALSVRYKDQLVWIDLDIIAPENEIASMSERINIFQQYMTAALNERVMVNADVIPVQILNIRSAPLPATDQVEEDILEDIE